MEVLSMGLRRPNQFTRSGRRLPGQSSDEDLGLQTSFNVKVYGDAAVVDWSLVQIGDVGKGNYIELGVNGIKIFNEGAETEIWSDVDGNTAQTEFRIDGVDATDPDAYIGLVATNFDSSAQVAFTLDTGSDRATLDAGQLLIGKSLRFSPVTTSERNALAAVNGMIVYNSTSNKFQGYAAGAWVDLH
jgi:hypothetical protein